METHGPEIAADAATVRHVPQLEDVHPHNGEFRGPHIDTPLVTEVREWLSMQGYGSVVSITGPPFSGKSVTAWRAHQDFRDTTKFFHTEDIEGAAMFFRDPGEHRHLVFDFPRGFSESFLHAVAPMLTSHVEGATPRFGVTLVGLTPLQRESKILERLRLVEFTVGREAASDGGRALEDARVRRLIGALERSWGVRYRRKDEFVAAARGSFQVAKAICFWAALRGRSPSNDLRPPWINTPFAVVRARAVDWLHPFFHSALQDLAQLDAKTRTPGAALVLLWRLARSRAGVVLFEEAKSGAADLEDAWNMIESTLPTFISKHEVLSMSLRCDAGRIECVDPALHAYLATLEDDSSKSSGSNYQRLSGWDDFSTLANHARLRVQFPLGSMVVLKAPAPIMPGSWSFEDLDFSSYPFHLPEAKSLSALLLELTEDLPEIRRLASFAGLAPLDLPHPVKPSHAWNHLLDLASRRGQFESFIRGVMADPDSASRATLLDRALESLARAWKAWRSMMEAGRAGNGAGNTGVARGA